MTTRINGVPPPRPPCRYCEQCGDCLTCEPACYCTTQSKVNDLEDLSEDANEADDRWSGGRDPDDCPFCGTHGSCAPADCPIGHDGDED